MRTLVPYPLPLRGAPMLRSVKRKVKMIRDRWQQEIRR
jgi:hypothetical protein